MFSVEKLVYSKSFGLAPADFGSFFFLVLPNNYSVIIASVTQVQFSF